MLCEYELKPVLCKIFLNDSNGNEMNAEKTVAKMLAAEVSVIFIWNVRICVVLFQVCHVTRLASILVYSAR